LPRRAHRARRSARFLSSLTVIVGMVITRYYHERPTSGTVFSPIGRRYAIDIRSNPTTPHFRDAQRRTECATKPSAAS
jgi:hypothetical protein